MIGFDIFRNVALGQLRRFHDEGELLGLFLDRNNIARLATVRTDVDALAVDGDVAVVDELAGGKDRGNELGAVDDGVETLLERPIRFSGVSPFIRLASS